MGAAQPTYQENLPTRKKCPLNLNLKKPVPLPVLICSRYLQKLLDKKNIF
jgi:hypothetical protein